MIKFGSLTLERVLKVLKAPVLKMTLFLLHRMKATMPITTINRKRGVRMAMIHRLLGGVFTTATNVQLIQVLFIIHHVCAFNNS